MRKVLIPFLLLSLLGFGCSAKRGAGIVTDDLPPPRVVETIAVAEREDGCFEVVEAVDGELLCLAPEQIGQVTALVVNLEADLGVCGAELQGCKSEVEIRKGSFTTKIQRWLLLFGGGLVTGLVLAD